MKSVSKPHRRESPRPVSHRSASSGQKLSGNNETRDSTYAARIDELCRRLQALEIAVHQQDANPDPGETEPPMSDEEKAMRAAQREEAKNQVPVLEVEKKTTQNPPQEYLKLFSLQDKYVGILKEKPTAMEDLRFVRVLNSNTMAGVIRFRTPADQDEFEALHFPMSDIGFVFLCDKLPARDLKYLSGLLTQINDAEILERLAIEMMQCAELYPGVMVDSGSASSEFMFQSVTLLDVLPPDALPN